MVATLHRDEQQREDGTGHRRDPEEVKHLVLPDHHPVNGRAVRGAVLGGRAAVAVGRAALAGIRADGVTDLTASASPGRHGACPRGGVDSCRRGREGGGSRKSSRLLMLL